MTSGSFVKGYVLSYTPASTPQKREICIGKPQDDDGDMRVLDLKLSPPNQNLHRRWDRIIVRGDEIAYIRVAYTGGAEKQQGDSITA